MVQDKLVNCANNGSKILWLATPDFLATDWPNLDNLRTPPTSLGLCGRVCQLALDRERPDSQNNVQPDGLMSRLVYDWTIYTGQDHPVWPMYGHMMEAWGSWMVHTSGHCLGQSSGWMVHSHPGCGHLPGPDPFAVWPAVYSIWLFPSLYHTFCLWNLAKLQCIKVLHVRHFLGVPMGVRYAWPDHCIRSRRLSKSDNNGCRWLVHT